MSLRQQQKDSQQVSDKHLDSGFYLHQGGYEVFTWLLEG